MCECWKGFFAGLLGGQRPIAEKTLVTVNRSNSFVDKVAGPSIGDRLETYSVGDMVEVYSNSGRVWCPGVVEWAGHQSVTVAFQVPGGKLDKYGRKDVPIGCQDLRKASAPTQWSKDEQILYAQLLQGVEAPDQYPRLFDSSRLPRRTLKEVWQVSNPLMKPQLGPNEFGLCCRLIGHCQAMQRDPGMQRLLEEGGENLRIVLQQNCVGRVPKQLARFSLTPSTDSPTARFMASTMMPAASASLISSSPGPVAFSTEERDAFTRFMALAGPPEQYPNFFDRSGLPRRALKEIWQVANPETKPVLGAPEFWLSCRLVGHCQAMQGMQGMPQLLEAGGPQLHDLLKGERCKGTSPNPLPNFHGIGVMSTCPHPLPIARGPEKQASIGSGGVTWSESERAAYTQCLAEAGPPDQHPQYFDRSGLPRKALKEIWQLANPQMKVILGANEFRMVCRLVGHCQLLQGNPSMTALLQEGGPPLKALLQERFMLVAPARLLVFQPRAVVATVGVLPPAASLPAASIRPQTGILPIATFNI